MRVLFSTTAGAGHFGPMIPIARACATAGYEVAVAAPASFATHVHQAGFLHLPFPDVPADTMGAVFARLPELPHEEANRIVVADVFGRLDAQAAYPTVLETMDTWRPDIVVRDPCELGGLIAAARLDVPQVQVAIGMASLLRNFAHWTDEPLRELEQIADLDALLGSERVLATPTFSSVPASLDAASDDHDRADRSPIWRYRAPSPEVDQEHPAVWGDPSAPLVYVSFGSVAGNLKHFGAIYPAMLAALADLPIRVLMTTGLGYDPARLDPPPSNAWVTRWWPQEAVMPETALVIGHGGFGTTMTALVAGVPQLVMPLFAHDQFVNAHRIHAVGAGLHIEGGVESIDQVPAAVMQLLGNSQFTEVARIIAAEVADLPDVANVVSILRDLVGLTASDNGC